MRIRFLATLSAAVLFATSGVWGQATSSPQAPQTPAAPQRPGVVFRATGELILVNVDVRDKNGLPVKGLKQEDFQVTEDGKPQEVTNFKYEEVAPTNTIIETAATLGKASTEKGAVPITVLGAPKPALKPAEKPAEEAPKKIDSDASPLTSDEVAGHRVWVLLFDTSSMEPDDVQRAVDSAIKWSNENMSPSDLVALLTVNSSLQVIQDITNDKTKIIDGLKKLSAADGTASAATDVDSSTMSSDEASATATASDTTTVDQSAQEIDSFNNDVRLRAIKTVCDNLGGFQQKKAMLYWSSGMARNGSDNQVELRAMDQSCVRANVTINPIDARGLQAVPPGGDSRTASKSGVSASNGANVASQFTALQAQQETLQAMASDTGGEAFTDSNDFGEAFAKVEKSISAYYILGYTTTNPNEDGKYRRIEVKFLPKMDVKIDARKGYYASRDFTHTAGEDRESQLLDQLDLPIPATDVPMFASAGYFRESAATSCPGAGRGRGGPGGFGGDSGPTSCFYVPVSIVVPGDAVPPQKDKPTTLDLRGYIRDERGSQIAIIKQTLTVPPAATEALAQKQVLYQTGAIMPPGRYHLKVAIRENTTGQLGTDEIIIDVPDLKANPVKVSSVVLSTQLSSVPPGYKTSSPLVQDGIEIMPNLTHVVNHDQKVYFYYEVYDPTQSDQHPQVRTNLAFYRGKVKVFETPVVERTTLDAPDRKAAIFRFVVPENSLKPGFYTCQVNIVDEAAGKFAFPRLDMYVR